MAKTDTDQVMALDKHKYRLHDGRVAVNVTAISSLLDDGKSGAFAGAAVNLWMKGLNHREEWKYKAERGTRIHTHLERRLRGDEDGEILDDEQGYVDALQKFLDEQDPQVLMQEAIALSNHGYGGRFDLICTIDGVVWLLDLKTGKEYVVEHTLQVSAYRYADGIAHYDADGKLMPEFKPIPAIDKAGCLYVNEDGTYKIVEYPADEEAFAQFLHLLEVHQWSRTPTMKQLIRESKAKT